MKTPRRREHDRIIRKCLFPAAGYGTRFLPATKAIPKEMLPVLTKPLLQYGVEEAIEAGMDTMAIVTGRGKRAIEDHFDRSYELEHQINGTSKEKLMSDVRDIVNEYTFSYTRQSEMKGLGHAIFTGHTLIGEEPFAVILADDLCDNDDKSVLTQMVEVYEKYPDCCIVAIEEVPKDQTNKYGIIAGEAIEDTLFRVHNMVEKPDPKDAPSNLAIIGRYILTPEIFSVLKNTKPGKGGEIQITDALLTLAKQGKVLAYKFQGRRFDCGSVDGFVAATNYFYNKMD
jgi:UTP--glucose-1-phosphate uridylyltransferase